MVGARVRRQQVAYAQGRGLSSRRACALLSVARSTLGYVSTLIARAAAVVPPLRTLAGQYPRYGYRTIRIFLERQGHALGTDRMYRLWRQEGLQVPKKRPRRRVAASRPRPLPPMAVNHVWAYDFVFDTCADGRSLKCLTIIDEFTRECLAIDVAGGIRSGRVIEVLTQLVSIHGAPRHLRSDNGPEFVARAIDCLGMGTRSEACPSSCPCFRHCPKASSWGRWRSPGTLNPHVERTTTRLQASRPGFACSRISSRLPSPRHSGEVL